MTHSSRILLIEDDPGVAVMVRRVLAEGGHDVLVEDRGDNGLARASQEAFNLVLTDLKMPGLNGLEIVRQLHAAQPHLPIIVMTAHGTTETAIEAMKLGAFDYLLKPFNMPQLLELVHRAAACSHSVSSAVAPPDIGAVRGTLVGKSATMQAIYKEIGRVAARPVSVLIRGETGTGKELAARAIHQHSDRARAPLVAINCAAVPETLLESELFGHERGAFTGAEARRIGRFEQADHGTIFLDEIGDMTPATQVKLVRVLQEKCLQRVGGKETIPVDVRVIAATHRDLETAIVQKQFREDLYYRLSVVVIQLPPLRQRAEDIPELVRHFLGRYGAELGSPNASIDLQALRLLQTQAWPGNVRELENVVRKALLLAQGYNITIDHVRMALHKPAGVPSAAHRTLGDYVDDLLAAASSEETAHAHARLLETAEKEIFTRAIHRTHGNQAQVARWLGLTRLTVREKLLHFGLHPTQQGPEKNAARPQ